MFSEDDHFSLDRVLLQRGKSKANKAEDTPRCLGQYSRNQITKRSQQSTSHSCASLLLMANKWPVIAVAEIGTVPDRRECQSSKLPNTDDSNAGA